MDRVAQEDKGERKTCFCPASSVYLWKKTELPSPLPDLSWTWKGEWLCDIAPTSQVRGGTREGVIWLTDGWIRLLRVREVWLPAHDPNLAICLSQNKWDLISGVHWHILWFVGLEIRAVFLGLMPVIGAWNTHLLHPGLWQGGLQGLHSCKGSGGAEIVGGGISAFMLGTHLQIKPESLLHSLGFISHPSFSGGITVVWEVKWQQVGDPQWAQKWEI